MLELQPLTHCSSSSRIQFSQTTAHSSKRHKAWQHQMGGGYSYSYVSIFFIFIVTYKVATFTTTQCVVRLQWTRRKKLLSDSSSSRSLLPVKERRGCVCFVFTSCDAAQMNWRGWRRNTHVVDLKGFLLALTNTYNSRCIPPPPPSYLTQSRRDATDALYHSIS